MFFVIRGSLFKSTFLMVKAELPSDAVTSYNNGNTQFPCPIISP